MALNGPPAAGGLFHSLRTLLATALGTVQLRLALVGTELEAEKLRLFDALWRVGLGLLMLGVAAVLAAAFVLLLFWDSYRLAALGVMLLLFVAGGVALLVWARAGLQASEGGPFALTLGELQRDLEGLRGVALPATAPTSESAPAPSPNPDRAAGAGPGRP